jgi:heme oxygenase
LGFFYVLEGSTLGGKIINRKVEADGGDLTGLSFLSPYGARTGERWRSFLAVLDEADVDEAATGAIVAGGVRAFETAIDWLCAPNVS